MTKSFAEYWNEARVSEGGSGEGYVIVKLGQGLISYGYTPSSVKTSDYLEDKSGVKELKVVNSFDNPEANKLYLMKATPSLVKAFEKSGSEVRFDYSLKDGILGYDSSKDSDGRVHKKNYQTKK